MSHENDLRAQTDRRLLLSIVLNLALVAGEVVAGVFSGSLALLSDAAHNVGDVVGLAVTFTSRKLGRRPPSQRFTYGLRRAEILAALVNGGFLLVVNTLIFQEAIRRFFHPVAVQSSLMAVTGLAALALNGVCVALLYRHSGEDLNLRSAFLHLVQDTLASGVVALAGLLAYFGTGSWVDPAASLVVGALVLRSAFAILWESLAILLEGAPRGLDLGDVEKAVHRTFEGVLLHHAHLWSVGPGEISFTGHIRVSEMALAEAQALSARLRDFLRSEFGIAHATLELECGACENADLLCNGTHKFVLGGGDPEGSRPRKTN